IHVNLQEPAVKFAFGKTKFERGFLLKRSTIVFIELGMIVGIIVSAYTLPGSTPLTSFLIAAGACFFVGNIVLVKKIQQIKAGETSAKKGPWPHIFQALGILAIFWLLIFLFFKH